MISIDITNQAMYAVSGKSDANGISVQAFGMQPLTEMIRHDGGSDIKRAAETMKKLLTPDFKGNAVSVLFSESAPMSHQYEFPYDKNPKNMLNIVKSGMTQAMSGNDYLMDYVILDTFDKEGATFCTVQVYIVERRLVEFTAAMISEAGKKPAVFQVGENAIYNLQNMGQGFGSQDVIATGVGSARISVTLLTTASKVLMRSNPVMGEVEAFNRVTEGTFEVSRAVDEATEQISKMLQYQSIKQPGVPMEHNYILGDYATPEIAAEISSSLDIPVSVLPQPAFVSAPAEFPFEKYAYATGALIEK